MISVTLSGGAGSQCCSAGAKYATHSLSIGGTYVVTQDGGNSCRWTGSYAGSYGWVKWWGDSGCTSLDNEYTVDLLSIVVTKYAAATAVQVVIWDGGSGATITSTNLDPAYKIEGECMGYETGPDNSSPGSTSNCVIDGNTIRLQEGDRT
jgi:hypothetical protein